MSVVWSCVAIFSVVTLIVFRIVAVRVADGRRRRRQQRLERQWLPLMIDGLEQAPDQFPPVDRRDMVLFLSLWNRLHDSVRGFNTALHHIAVLAGADKAARHMLSGPHVREKLLAITTLGRLRDRAMWDKLVRLAAGRESMLSLAAARAMVRIDAGLAMRLLLPVVAKREDWPPATVGLMLEDAGPAVISNTLVDAVRRAPAARQHRLIRFLGLAHSEATLPLLRLLIRRVNDVESITACLRVFTDGTDLGAVRAYLSHPRWEVRVRAVEALGRLGTDREERSLVSMLSDHEWWVRYRAAQALCKVLSSNLDRVRQLSATLGDPFARDILAHVLAEQAVAA